MYDIFFPQNIVPNIHKIFVEWSQIRVGDFNFVFHDILINVQQITFHKNKSDGIVPAIIAKFHHK
jgi:hypothetical protein